MERMLVRDAIKALEALDPDAYLVLSDSTGPADFFLTEIKPVDDIADLRNAVELSFGETI